MRAYVTFDAANYVFNAKPTARSIVALWVALIMLLAASGGLSLAVAADEEEPDTSMAEEEEDTLEDEEEAAKETPTIEGFDYGHSYGDLYYFVGEVTGLEDNSGVDVEFGDIIEGEMTTTDIDGTFFYETELPSGVADWASAVATSVVGVQSEEVLIWVETL